MTFPTLSSATGAYGELLARTVRVQRGTNAAMCTTTKSFWLVFAGLGGVLHHHCGRSSMGSQKCFKIFIASNAATMCHDVACSVETHVSTEHEGNAALLTVLTVLTVLTLTPVRSAALTHRQKD